MTKLISLEELEEAEARGEDIDFDDDDWLLEDDEPSSRWTEMSYYKKSDTWAIEREYAEENSD